MFYNQNIMVTLTIELPDALDGELEKIAERENSTKTDVAQRILQESLTSEAARPSREYLEKYLTQNGTPAPESFAARAEKYIGVASGGATDLSTNPAHLENFGK